MTHEEQLANYLSHRWNSLLTSTPGNPDEWTTVCRDCGIEDQGSPLEFDLDYPRCDTEAVA